MTTFNHIYKEKLSGAQKRSGNRFFNIKTVISLISSVEVVYSVGERGREWALDHPFLQFQKDCPTIFEIFPPSLVVHTSTTSQSMAFAFTYATGFLPFCQGQFTLFQCEDW